MTTKAELSPQWQYYAEKAVSILNEKRMVVTDDKELNVLTESILAAGRQGYMPALYWLWLLLWKPKQIRN